MNAEFEGSDGDVQGLRGLFVAAGAVAMSATIPASNPRARRLGIFETP